MYTTLICCKKEEEENWECGSVQGTKTHSNTKLNKKNYL